MSRCTKHGLSWLKRIAAAYHQRYKVDETVNTSGPWVMPDPGASGNWAGATSGHAAVLIRCSMEELERVPGYVYEVLGERWLTFGMDPELSLDVGEIEVGELVRRCGGPRKWNQWPTEGLPRRRVDDKWLVEFGSADRTARSQFDGRLVSWVLSPAFPEDRAVVRLFDHDYPNNKFDGKRQFHGLFVLGPSWVAMMVGVRGMVRDVAVAMGP